MKKITVLFTMIYCCFTAVGQNSSIYSLQVNDIDGNAINLSSFQGKKILICTVPLNVSNADVNQLDSLIRANSSKIKVIGVPSIEDGYTDSIKADVKNIFQSRGINLTLTEGMYTKKSSGTNQSALMSWLTKKDLNTRFNFEVKGIGQKFFTDANGKLLGSLDSQANYLSTSVKNFIYLKL